MKKRVCVYIDGANFYGGLTLINEKFSDTKFDFENYVVSLTKHDQLVCVYYYNALVKKKVNEKIWNKQNNFFERLRKISNYKVSLCTRKSRLNILGEEYHTIKGDDILLALDMVKGCYENEFDKAILISGDGDFTEVIKRIKDKGKVTQVCYFKGCESKTLVNAADTSMEITKKIANKYFYRGN